MCIRDSRLTHQEIRILSEISIDFESWNQPQVSTIWAMESAKETSSKSYKQIKKTVFDTILDRCNQDKKLCYYHKNEEYHISSQQRHPNFNFIDSGSKIFGSCPVASDKTICCNLITLDAIHNCGFSCNYCCIQSFYQTNTISFEGNLREKLEQIHLETEKVYHIGTGQSSDSLMWGDKNGVLTDLCYFASKNPNIILEFKTKSKNVTFFTNGKNTIPRNVICSWSLNTNTVAIHEERGCATPIERLDAARTVADQGVLVAFHFHPMVHYHGGEEEYAELFAKVQEMFLPEEIAFISFGTLTYTKPNIREIRITKKNTKVLQMPLELAAGKYTYPQEVKEQLFTCAYNSFKAFHKSVFFYLCMEERKYCDTTFGSCFKNNQNFENTFNNAVMDKIRKRHDLAQ